MLVLLTRALDEAMRTAAKLFAVGHHAILSPVLEMTPTGAPWPPGAVDGIIATSTQAFELLSDGEGALSPEARRLVPVYVVGERTEAAARERGFLGRIVVEQDARDLAANLVAALAVSPAGPPARFVYLAGRDRKPDLEAAVRAAGHEVATVEVYVAQAAEELDEEAAALLEVDRIGAALHYSRRSVEIFLKLAAQAEIDVSGAHHVAISPDAAAPLEAAGLPHVHVAAAPREQAMLDLLVTLAPRESVSGGRSGAA
ncbi:uroporphyrinogen-III synthase [Methylocella sp.]|uniref:uroporphyrinogen-III synthase n=1 Tax=Methylocella sp. TaxID=1978226 RepID=UPI0037851FF7